MPSIQLLFYPLLFPFITASSEEVTQTPSHTVIRPYFIGKQWNVSILEEKKVFHSSQFGDDLFLRCDAPFPITWNLVGFISHPKVVRIPPSKRDLVNHTFEIQLKFSQGAKQLPTLAASLQVICEQVGDSSIRDEVFVFIKLNETEYPIFQNHSVTSGSTVVPEGHLNDAERQESCSLTGDTYEAAYTVSCLNPMDCEVMSRCFHNETDCNTEREERFPIEKNTTLDHNGFVTAPYLHPSGIAMCHDNGTARRWMYFESFKHIKYVDWRDAPTSELVRLEEIRSKHVPGATHFICTAVAFLFADSLSFEIEFKNGSRKLLQGNGNTVNISNTEVHPRRIDGFNVVGILEIQLPPTAQAIHCLAPWWNSTEAIIASTTTSFLNTDYKWPTFYDDRKSSTVEVGKWNWFNIILGAAVVLGIVIECVVNFNKPPNEDDDEDADSCTACCVCPLFI